MASWPEVSASAYSAPHVTFEKPLVRFGHKLARRDKPFHAV
jgi:hypothetical protein